MLFRNRSWKNLFYWNLAALAALLTATATLADDSQDHNGRGNDNGGQSGGDGHRHDNGTIVSVSKTEATLTPPSGQSGSGHVEAEYVETTTSTNQSFSVDVSDLAGSSTFQVNVTLTDGSTASAGSISTDSGGSGELKLSSSTNSQGGGGDGEDNASENEDNNGGDQPLPSALDPVTHITHVDILDANNNIVLSGDLTASGDLFHKVQSTTLISNGRAIGKTQIDIRHTNKLRQTITVSGSKLAKGTKVQVQLDGVPVGKAKTNAAGKLSLKSSVPPSIKAEHSQQIDVLDAKGKLLLTGQLPN